MLLVIRYAKRSTWAAVKKNSGLREQVGVRNELLDSHVIEKTTSQVYRMGLPHGHPPCGYRAPDYKGDHYGFES